MAIKSFGSITIQDVVDEFGGDVSHSLNEYYRGGPYVPNISENSTIPTSGSISLDDFYGTVNIFIYSPSANVQELDLIEAAKTAGWNELSVLRCQINGDIWAWSDNTANPAILVKNHPAPVQVFNFGKIIGKGGRGGNNDRSASDGGPAIESQHPNVSITNFSGAYIAGGGGGGAGGGQTSGGGGAGGGRAGNGEAGTGGAGGAIGEKGANGTGSNFGLGRGGEAGGAGGGVEEKKGTDHRCSGGGGGRILPGIGINATRPTWPGGYGGKGGQSGGRTGRYSYTSPTTGGFNNHGGGGGGGWGSAGGNAFNTSGGAGGRAIKFNTSANKPSLTNNGTIYGATD